MLLCHYGGKMTVYIEYALIDNLVIDYLILKATFSLMGVARSKGRLFLSALFASVLALIFPLISLSSIATLLKLVMPITVVVISGKFSSKKEFFFCVAIFLSITFAFGGSVSGIYSILGIELASEFCVSTVIIPVCFISRAVLRLVKHFYKRKTFDNFVYLVKVFQGEMSLELKGFLDTGNGVYDGKNPVVFLRKELAKKLFASGKNTKVKSIEINTVNGCDKKILFTLERIEILVDNSLYIYNDVCVCVSDKIGYNYDLLLHPALFEVKNENDAKMQEVV